MKHRNNNDKLVKRILEGKFNAIETWSNKAMNKCLVHTCSSEAKIDQSVVRKQHLLRSVRPDHPDCKVSKGEGKCREDNPGLNQGERVRITVSKFGVDNGQVLCPSTYSTSTPACSKRVTESTNNGIDESIPNFADQKDVSSLGRLRQNQKLA